MVREIREEIGATMVNARYLATLENRFTLDGVERHEIVLVYEGELADRALYEASAMEAQEANGERFKVLWEAALGLRHRLDACIRTGF